MRIKIESTADIKYTGNEWESIVELAEQMAEKLGIHKNEIVLTGFHVDFKFIR